MVKAVANDAAGPAPESESDVLLFTVAAANMFRTRAGIVKYANEGVYLPRAEGVAFVARGVLLPPHGVAISATEMRTAARLAYEQLEKERVEHGFFSEGGWLGASKTRARQYSRVLAAIKEGVKT
jgi:hypothetical protein